MASVMCEVSAAAWHLGPIPGTRDPGCGQGCRMRVDQVQRDAHCPAPRSRRSGTLIGAVALCWGVGDSRGASVSVCKVVWGEILKLQGAFGHEALFHTPVIFSSLLTFEAHTVREEKKKLGMLSVCS